MKLYRNDGWRQTRNKQAFLARVAWRVAVDARRRSASQPAASAPQLTPDAASPLDSDPLCRPARRGSRGHRLTARRASCTLVLSSFGELNSREIGGILGVPEGTVRTRLPRARPDAAAQTRRPEEVRYA